MSSTHSEPLAPWRPHLARALHRNRALAHARYVQLATLQPNGCPANRTIVFRGFREQHNSLKFITDSRSQKVIQLQHNPNAELCWYFPKTREQFRIAGTLSLIGPDAPPPLQTLCLETWQQLSESARTQFFWPAPGSAYELASWPTENLPVENMSPVFRVLLLLPRQVDHLLLRESPHQRYLYRATTDAGWEVAQVAP